MKKDKTKKSILEGVRSQQKEIFDTSKQPMYLYLDDQHKFCNQKFASLLGYKSAAEWAAIPGNFPTTFVESKSQRTLISAYRNAMEKGVGSCIRVDWKKKSVGIVSTSIILVPIVFLGQRMALHFVYKRK